MIEKLEVSNWWEKISLDITVQMYSSTSLYQQRNSSGLAPGVKVEQVTLKYKWK